MHLDGLDRDVGNLAAELFLSLDVPRREDEAPVSIVREKVELGLRAVLPLERLLAPPRFFEHPVKSESWAHQPYRGDGGEMVDVESSGREIKCGGPLIAPTANFVCNVGHTPGFGVGSSLSPSADKCAQVTPNSTAAARRAIYICREQGAKYTSSSPNSTNSSKFTTTSCRFRLRTTNRILDRLDRLDDDVGTSSTAEPRCIDRATTKAIRVNKPRQQSKRHSTAEQWVVLALPASSKETT